MKSSVERFLNLAGIQINGPNPWDIQVLDERFYKRVFADQTLGLGESYMDGWWKCEHIDEMIYRLMKADIDQQVKPSPREIITFFLNKLFNYQSKSRSKEVAEKHYDIGNSLYQKMLGPTMNYSCGYWKDASDLDTAEVNKMELICQKLRLEPGLRLLDIGCGWGSLAKYAAENYGVEVVGITISGPQMEYAIKSCQGLPIKIVAQDYRDLPPEQQFDRIVSVGMFEHVGYKNYRTFMEIVSQHLSQDGIFLLHTIGGNMSNANGDAWISKYIFPNGMLPSIEQIGKAIDNLFIMEDWHNFGVYYDKTLLEWDKRFNAHWSEIKDQYDEKFHRMWDFYLLSCAGAFRARRLQLWQIVLTKSGLTNGFQERILTKKS